MELVCVVCGEPEEMGGETSEDEELDAETLEDEEEA